MHKPESVLTNQSNKIMWNIEIESDYLIPVRGPDAGLIGKHKNLDIFWTLQSYDSQKEK